MPGESTFIYCLIDPRDDHVRYVGKADNVVSRYRQHCKPRSNTPVCNWIKSLAKSGEIPIVATLCRVASERWPEAESLFIEKYRRETEGLLNVSDGGTAPTNPHQAKGRKGELSRLKWKLSTSLKDKYLSDEAKERIRAKMRYMYRKHPDLFECWSNI